MKQVVTALCAGLLTLSAVATVAFAGPETAKKPMCPIQKEAVTSIDPKLTSVYKGKTFYFCCSGCKPAFDKMSDKDKVALMKYGIDTKKTTAAVKGKAATAPKTAAPATGDTKKPAA
jgi:YHS domain-containing protein